MSGCVAGVINMALRFDGRNDLVRVPRMVADDFTIEAWIRTSASADGSKFYQGLGLIYADVSGNQDDFGIVILNDHFALGTGNPDTTVESTTEVTTSEWMHVAAVRTQATGRLCVLVNGVEERCVTSSNRRSLTAASSIDMGGNTIDNRYFEGELDELRIWNVARSESEIQATMQQRMTGNERNLVGYWPFDELNGDRVEDRSPGQNHGMLGNGNPDARPTLVPSDILLD